MKENNIEILPCDDLGTIVHIAIDNKYKGHIHIGDKIKPTAKQAISNLKKIGINQVTMLTGDDKKVANQINEELKFDKVYSNLLPQDKVEIIKTLNNSKNNSETLVFVGDGINDAPVIALADIGI